MKNGNVAADQLRSIVSRIENLEESKSGIAQDIADIYSESKSSGFDTKAIRQIIKLRKLDAQTREELEFILDTYLHALGMVAESDAA